MKSIVRFRQFLCLLLLGLCLAAAGLGSSAALGVSGMSPSHSGAFPTCGRLAVGFHYDGVKQGSIAYDNSSNAALRYDGTVMSFADRRQTASKVTHSIFSEFAEFLAAEGTVARQTTILGENMAQRVMPFADQTGARTLGFGATREEWAAMSPAERWKLNDGMLRARINEGDAFRYIGQDPLRNPALRTQFA